MKPMKISHATETELQEFLNDPWWVMQQKMDGARVIIRYSQVLPEIDFFNSQGKPLKFAAAQQHLGRLRAAMEYLILNHELSELVLDGELMQDGTFYAFDVPHLVNKEVQIGPNDPLSIRLRSLERVLHLSKVSGQLRCLPVFADPTEKREAFKRFETAGVEGAVFKFSGGSYAVDGDRTQNQAKYKFVKDADVVILERDRKGTKNAILGVYDEQMNIVEIGSCSMIGKPDLQPGDVARVKYLYWSGEAMIQPRLVEQRTDKLPSQCDLEQFPLYSRDVVGFVDIYEK